MPSTYAPEAIERRKRERRAYFARRRLGSVRPRKRWRKRRKTGRPRARIGDLERELAAARREYRWWDIAPIERRLVAARTRHRKRMSQ